MEEKHITKEKFLRANKVFGLLDTIIHHEDKVIVDGDEVLTEEIMLLKAQVKQFEEKTGLTLSVS